MKILISAAESSSDAHGAELLKRLQEIDPQVRAFGVGGPKLRAAGLRALIRAEDLSVMGFTEVLGRLPKIVESLGRIERAVAWERPNLAIVLDYPDFHFKLIRRLKKLGVPVVYFIPPKIWAWRKGRARFLKRNVEAVLGIFPFEVPFYAKTGIRFHYVGNPLVDELPLDLARDEARAKLGLSNLGAQAKVVTLMPGSRPAEVRRHFDLMLESVRLASSLVQEKIEVLVPLPDSERAEWLRRRWFTWVNALPASQRNRFHVRISHGDAALCLIASDAGLIKSGTSTLEAGLLGCPHLALYVPSPMSCWIFKHVVRYKGDIALSNLVLGERKPGTKPVFREYYCDQAQASALSRELYQLIKNPERIEECRRATAAIREALGASESPSLKAAQVAREIGSEIRDLKARRFRFRKKARSFLIWLSSALWSTVNAIVTRLVLKGWVKPVRLNARVVSVGNIQAGGAGKTPIVARMAREAIQRGLRVCVLTRGYGGVWEDTGGVILPREAKVDPVLSGDEPALLQELVPESTIAVGADRLAAYRRAVELSERDFDWVILDDGLQNFRIAKDLEIVALTSKRRSEVVYRDWNATLKRADLLVWTKGEDSPVEEGDSRLVRAHYDYPDDLSLLKGKPLFLVTAVADGQLVRAMLEGRGLSIEVHRSFKDHAAFTAEIAAQIAKEASERQLLLAMTGKDHVKWKEFGLEPEVLRLEPELNIVEGERAWNRVLWGESSLFS